MLTEYREHATRAIPRWRLMVLVLTSGCHWSYPTSAFFVVEGTLVGYDQWHPRGFWYNRWLLQREDGLSKSRSATRGGAVGWVNEARKELAAGRQVDVRPSGGSMRGRIESGQLVTLAPVAPADVRVNDVVLVAWRGNFLLHLVLEARSDELLIGNNLGKVNGWVATADVVGKVIAVQVAAPDEPDAAPK